MEDEGAEEGDGEGDRVKVVKKIHICFRQFQRPTFFMMQKTFVHFYDKKATLKEPSNILS